MASGGTLRLEMGQHLNGKNLGHDKIQDKTCSCEESHTFKGRTQAFGGRTVEKEQEVEGSLSGNETVERTLEEELNSSCVLVDHR